MSTDTDTTPPPVPAADPFAPAPEPVRQTDDVHGDVRGEDDVPDAPRRPGPAPDPSKPRSRARARAKKATAAAPRPRTSRAKKPPEPDRPDYKGVFLATVASVVMPVASAASVTNNDPLMADCIATTDAAPDLADDFAGLCVQYPQMGALVERWAGLVPAAGFGTKLLTLFAQFAVNHGRVPPSMVPGSRDIVGGLRAARETARPHPESAAA